MQQEEFLPKLAAYLMEAARKNDGKAPSERDLAEHFSVSRGQVREALAILEAMQVIERRAKSGIYVNGGNGGIEAMSFFARFGLPLENRQIFEAVEVRKIHEIRPPNWPPCAQRMKILPICATFWPGRKNALPQAAGWMGWIRSSILKSCGRHKTPCF